MIKRLITILISLVLFTAFLSGCTLVTLDNNRDMSRPVAVIAPRTFTYVQDGTAKTFTDKERVITKAQLVNSFNQQARSFSEQNNGQSILDAGYTPSKIMEMFLDNLVERQLFLREAQFLLEKQDIVITQKDKNEIWKQIYDTIDEYIFSQEQAIDKERNEDIYEKGTGQDSEPEYPAREDYYTPEIDEDVAVEDEAVWVPEQVRYPKFDDNMTAQERKEAARTVEGMRLFVEYLKEVVEANKPMFTPEEAIKYQESLEALKAYDGAEPAKYAKLYPELKNIWMVEHIFYEGAYEELLFNKFQQYFVKQAELRVDNEAIQREYNNVLDRQKNLFKSDMSAYKSARGGLGSDDASEYVILYDPVGAEQYYVKHVLLPFAEGDDNIANIKVLERDIYGEPMTAQGTKSAYTVLSEMRTALNGKTNLREIDIAFTDFIFKYNTDPGMFNNRLGYGVKDLESFVPEFVAAAKELYDNYKKGVGGIGSLSDMVPSSHGVHIIMLSSVVTSGEKRLNDWTDATQSTTYYDAIKDRLVELATSAAIEEFQYALNEKKQGEWKDDIVKYSNRYRDIIKNLEKQV